MKPTDPPASAFAPEYSKGASSNNASGEEATSRNATEGRDPATGQFVKGFKGGPGRRRGSRAKLGEAFVTDLYNDWLDHGIEAVARVRFSKPHVYLAIIGRILPQKIEISTPTDSLSDERLAEMLEIAERMAGLHAEQAKVIDVTPTALPAPAVTIETLATPPSRSPGRDAAAAAKRADLEDQAAAARHGEPARPSAAVVDEDDIDPASLF